MKSIILSLSLLLIASSGYAQIIAPDTVCINEPVTFTTNHHAVHYAWSIDTAGTQINIGRVFNATNVRALHTGAPVNTPASVGVAYDNGVYYVFTPNFFQNSLARLAFTNGLYAPPVTTNMGNFGGALASSTLEGMEVVRDDNGQWYVFILDGSRLVRVDFGTSLANNPTTGVAIPLPYTPNYELQLTIKKYNNEWIAFTGGYGNPTITRIDFGTSITNTNPTFTGLPTGALSLQSPGYFTLHEQNGAWYMLATCLHGTRNGISLVRFDFGANLKNNNPTITSLGNPGNQYSLARAILTVTDCDSFYSLTMNENATYTHLDFNNDIRNNSPAATALGSFVPMPVGKQTLHSYWANDTLFLLASDFRGHNVYSYPLIALTAPVRAIRYHNPDFTHTFTTPGVYNVTLQCDQALNSGSKTLCKQIVVVDGREGFLGPDTVICAAQSYTLDAGQPGATGYRWSTGEATPSIVVTSPGTYWVDVSGQVCGQRDTVTVGFTPSPHIDLGSDFIACEGDNIVLASQGGTYTAPAYQWNNGANTPSINVTTSGTYILTITDQGCEASDTITITVNPAPVASIGNDTNVCVSAFPLTLESAQPPGTSYLWSNGYSTQQMQINRGGTYWLEVRIGDCIDSDTIQITGIPDPEVFIGFDTVICEQFPLRLGVEIEGVTYHWSTGSTDPYIHVNATGDYVLGVNLDGCRAYDTIHITALPPPDTDLGGDRDICPEQTIVLNASYGQNSSYIWNTGETSSDIAVTKAGVYSVIVTSQEGCVGGDTVVLTYYPKPVVLLGADTVVCEETPLQLQPWAINTDSLLWSDGSYGNRLSIRYGGQYIVTAINKCGTTSDTIEVKQIFCDIWLPNAFTPNGDGVNDVFRILGNIGRIEGVTLSVFNRWGERIFITNDKLQGWDGYHKGRKMSLGTYVYLLQYSLDGKPYVLKGSFHLLR